MGTILNLIDSIPKCDFEIMIEADHKWEEHYQNSIYIAELPPPPERETNPAKIEAVKATDGVKEGGYELITD